MPWWSRKSRSKPKPGSAASCSSSPRKQLEEAERPNPNPNRRSNTKEKANSFDEAFVRKAVGGSGPASLFAFGHPLPRPLSSPLPSIPHDLVVAASASASASASSSSSSGSDETPDLGFYRYPEEGINMTRGRNLFPDSQKHHFMVNTVSEHPRRPELSISTKNEFHSFCVEASSHHQTSCEIMFNTAHNTRGHPLPTSPIHSRATSVCPGSPKLRQDDLKTPPHPLPLPPSSPGSSSSSRSSPSPWKKGKLLGRGTFGHVYFGFNSESGQMCAIKEVEVISDDSNSKECLRQLNQEITLLSQLSHPNIVRYYGSELGDDTLSVYLEYVSGGSIYKLLQEYGPFREPVIRNYTRQILSGLAYLHGRNTLHRDIKGANILVDPNGEVKLADFGMAKHMSACASIRSFKGSPYWMAPEVIMNGNGYNISVDIWSLGCTMLEMATSKPPWSQFEGIPAIFKIANSKEIPDIPDHLSSSAKNFLQLCLRRDPASRPTAADLMDHPFVRDQGLTKPTKSSMFRDTLSPLPDGSLRMIVAGNPLSRRCISRQQIQDRAPPSYSCQSACSATHSQGRNSCATKELSNRSVSPLRDRDYRVGHLAGFPLASRNQSDLMSMRMNMSLPVSPCSSPLRQFKQHNRSCLPSPPHPAYSAGAINYGPSNYSLYPARPSNIFDLSPDIPPQKAQTPYGSPRR